MARSNLCGNLPGSLLSFLILFMVLGGDLAALAKQAPPTPVGLSLYPIPPDGNSLPVKCAVTVDTDMDSSKVKVGDVIHGTLKQSLLITPTYNAAPGSQIIGKVVVLKNKRTLAKSIVSSDRRLAQDDTIDIVFTDLYCPDQKHFYITGRFSKQKINIPLSNGHVRSIAVNKDGELVHEHEVLKLQQKAGNWVGQYVIQAATVTSGVFTGGIGLIAVPLVMGVAGSISPPFVTNSPVDPDEKHPRLKGFGWGFVNAIPGSTIVEAFICKGDDTELEQGMVMFVDFKPPAGAATCSVKAEVAQASTQAPQPPVQIAAQTAPMQTPMQTAAQTPVATNANMPVAIQNAQPARSVNQAAPVLKAQNAVWDSDDTEALTWPEPNRQVASVGAIY